MGRQRRKAAAEDIRACSRYDGLMKNGIPLLFLSISLLAFPGCRHQKMPVEPEHQYSASIVLGPSSSPLWEAALPSIKSSLETNCDMSVSTARWQDDQSLIRILNRAGSEGTSLVVCTGGGVDRALELVAPRYSESLFLVQGSFVMGANVRMLGFRLNGASYLAGVATSLLKPEAIAVIEGCGGPWLESVESGFKDGLRRRNYRNTILNLSSMKALDSLPSPQASVALYACDAPDPAVVSMASKSGLKLIGIGVRKQESMLSPYAGRIVIDLGEALRRVGEDVEHGMSAESGYDFDLGSGVVDFKVNPQLEILNSPEAQRKLDEARSAITAGVVEIEQMGM